MENEKGITLISLIVTIIILLILAGVTINIVLDDNGIIQKAKYTQQITEISNIVETIKLEILDYQTVHNGKMTETALDSILKKYGEIIYEGNIIQKIITTDKKYEIARKDIIGELTIIKDVYNNDSVLYCWDWEQSKIENMDNFFNMCDELKITSVYFCFDKLNWTTYKEDTKTFINTLNSKNISIFALSGDPSWAYEASYITNFTDTVVNYNRTVSDNEKILGIVLDIEPAGTSKWIQNENEAFKKYVQTQKDAYKYAKNNALLVIQCIPYWFDEVNYELLEELVKNACDGISVMNYWKNNTVELIKNEMSLAKEHSKYIDSIAEFGETSGNVTEDNTFYNDGLEAAIENWNNMKKVYNYDKFGTAYHDYGAISKIQGGTYSIEIYANSGNSKVTNKNIKVINVNRPNVDYYTSTTTSEGYAVFWLEYGKTYMVEIEDYGTVYVKDDLSKQYFSYLKKDGNYFVIDVYVKPKEETTTYNAEIYFKDENSNLITNKEVTITNTDNQLETYNTIITNGGYISIWVKHGVTYRVKVKDYTVINETFIYGEDVGSYKAFDINCK